ncbi:uncharacterized protein LOC116845659 isoform X2 [Odontomachus brunneus]|uniref:uncharacterized protein LOC116845659 isoform X2 n=1 Tax=Odontomachus brunneus TaxID=486640 RepID=UPI0013F1BFDD|nr:uncharacterized protein LOC116845659 isoform X2 [Odontomachus brunneus]
MVYGSRRVTESVTTGIAWLHNITNQGEMSSSGGFGVGVGVAGGPTLAAAQQGQGVAALLVMLAVLCFIFAYCCWGAPFCRSLCRRHCCCRLEDPEPDPRFGGSDQAMVATPTIILLPHGRMLVVDGTIFTQFQTDPTGLDLVELGDSVLRAQRNPRSVNRHQLQSSQGSIEMDAETPSKDSLGSIGCFPPPTYESIYGKEETDMPPSYSDILLHRFANLPHEIDMRDYCRDGKEEIEMQSLESCPHIVGNPLNSMPYHPYATVTSLSSLQSYPRRNVSRNPSIISNPLDNYYVDNELGVYRLSREMIPRVSSNANLESFHTSHDEMSFRVPVDENENLRHTSRNNERRQPTVEHQAVRNAGNEVMNTRNRARSISRLSQDSRRSSLNREMDQHQTAAAFVRLPDPEDVEASRDRRVDEDQRPRLYREDQNARNPRLDHVQVQDEVNRNVVDGDPRYFARNRRLENEDRNQGP